MEFNWICVTRGLYLSSLMCCHKAPASSTHERPRESGGISSNSGSMAEPMNVWLRELLCDRGMNYPDSLWLGSFRLSASLCVRYGARAGLGLWLSPVPRWEPVSSHLFSPLQAVLSIHLPPQCVMIPLWCRWVLKMISHCTWDADQAVQASNRLTLFYSLSWLVNWSPAPCWHSDHNGGELLLSCHALPPSSIPSPPPFINPAWISDLPPPLVSQQLGRQGEVHMQFRRVTCPCASGSH